LSDLVLDVKNLTVRLPAGADRENAIEGISLQVKRGEIVCIVGESGSGKSTLLHLIGGLDTADSGRVAIEGTDLTALNDAGRAALRRGTVGVIFQQFNLIPSLTVTGNIAFQARLAGRNDPARNHALADRLGLGAHLHKYPEQLSGGQQQRVAVARALANHPSLILADEPTAALDGNLGRQVMELFQRIAHEQNAGVIVVTHDHRSLSVFDRILEMEDGMLRASAAQPDTALPKKT
jgi:putative ABC transport system ATP-binding protein